MPDLMVPVAQGTVGPTGTFIIKKIPFHFSAFLLPQRSAERDIQKIKKRGQGIKIL
jgi:hypothetical protein